MALKIRSNVPTALLMILGALAIGCGDDDDDDGPKSVMDASLGDGGGGGGDAGDAGVPVARTEVYEATVVGILAEDNSAPLPAPHEVIALDNTTGLPLVPPSSGISTAVTGKVRLTNLPTGLVMLHVKGVGQPAETGSTYDSIIANVTSNLKNDLVRVSSAGTLALAENSGGFMSKPDRAAVSGIVYWSPDGVRKGTVGCAKVYIDDRTDVAADWDQRYNAASGLPTTLAMQSQTLRAGRYYIANVPKGQHKLRVSFDNGQTFTGETTFIVPFTRSEATSVTKSVIVQVGIDLKTATNPTPASCP